MGTNVDREHFDANDHARFAAQLQADLDALQCVLALPGFGEGPITFGAELELSLVDREGLALPKNREVIETAPQTVVGFFMVGLALIGFPMVFQGETIGYVCLLGVCCNMLIILLL